MNIDLHGFLQEDIQPCKGRVYRGHVSCYMSENGTYTYKETMVPLKRMSCRGCDKCGAFDETLQEDVYSQKAPMINNIEDGAIYQLQFVNCVPDWETGFIDDFDLEFIKIVK